MSAEDRYAEIAKKYGEIIDQARENERLALKINDNRIMANLMAYIKSDHPEWLSKYNAQKHLGILLKYIVPFAEYYTRGRGKLGSMFNEVSLALMKLKGSEDARKEKYAKYLEDVYVTFREKFVDSPIFEYAQELLDDPEGFLEAKALELRVGFIRKSSMIRIATRSYTAIVLDPASRDKLLAGINKIPSIAELVKSGGMGDAIAHHLTVTLGELKDEAYQKLLGKGCSFQCVALGISDKAIAVKCAPIFKFGGDELDWTKVTRKGDGKFPHITIYVNKAVGGKPIDSNLITTFIPLKGGLKLTGTLKVMTSPG